METTAEPQALAAEVERLHAALRECGWSREECALHAPLTLEIRRLARARNAIILAHSYMTPDIQAGIADYRGDSLGLSEKARDTDAEVIVFCGVRFMAETAKILAPHKLVLHPAPEAGCSLADSITAAQVRELRARYPRAAIVCYVNTSAEVKAECDVCVTSANALAVIQALPERQIVFLPDRYMAENLRACTDKEIIGWDGVCIVHEQFTPERARAWRAAHPRAHMLVHLECSAATVGLADMAGGTGDMIRYIKAHPEVEQFMLVTECGLSDRMRMEFPDRTFIGTCALCPHMKRVELRRVLQCLQQPLPEQVVELDERVRVRALRSLERMFELTPRPPAPATPR
ncbi:MAG: quinolinate synthase A [Planctomycetota bacterium]|nr:MAG: quinolinate synthase A [Planctomycetota bacterium]